MNKGKIFSFPTSEEAQIRTRARKLPIDKCYISKNWETSPEADVAIARRHTNGNITTGFFRVDLKLRGVKECSYDFNVSPLRLDELLERFPNMFEECDYNLAHNVILAAVEFAEEFGFAPHKNFKTAQYILEEDTEDIPMMEIPLGDNGIPVLTIPHGENCEREIALLNKTAGINYKVQHLDKDGNPIAKERPYAEVLDEALATSFNEFADKYHGAKTMTERQVMIDLIYVARVFTKEEQDQIDAEVQRIVSDPRVRMPFETEHDYDDEFQSIVDLFVEGKKDRAIAASRKLISKYDNDPFLWDIFIDNLSIDSDCVDGPVVQEAYALFPENPAIKAWYAEYLAQEDRIDEVFELFDNKPDLNALTTENIHINARTLVSFCLAYAAAWINKKDILRAEPYYQIINHIDCYYRMADYVKYSIMEMKGEKIEEMAEAGVFGDEE